ncbi:hypothetical protein F4778DRAFT_776427 [Xylariomycetidae sp. FL2044]|nr:hypothetical protein F4778DRAFT_776427 [Xylariomycetidae sp. FL2044]
MSTTFTPISSAGNSPWLPERARFGLDQLERPPKGEKQQQQQQQQQQKKNTKNKQINTTAAASYPRSLARFGEKWATGDPRTRAHLYCPSDDQYRLAVQDLAALHRALWRTARAIESSTLTPKTSSCGPLWESVWAAVRMAGAATDDVWHIVRYAWLRLLRETARLGPGEWEALRTFLRDAGAVVRRCDEVLARWDPRREREGCLELYGVLREYPVPRRMRRTDETWQRQDRRMCNAIYRVQHPVLGRVYSLFMYSL